MSVSVHAVQDRSTRGPTENRSKKRACTTALNVRVEGVEPLMDALAGGTEERRLLARMYAGNCEPEQVRAAARGLVLLMLSREADIRRALALCDHAHASLRHAEKVDDYGAVPGDSEATDGRSLAVVIGRCLDVLASPLRAPEHTAARADLAALFATWDERIIEPWIAVRLRKHHRGALAAEYAAWKAA